MIDQLKELLKTAGKHLAEARSNAAAALLDFGADAGKSALEDRRKAAAAAMGSESADYFKKTYEKPILKELADHLARLLAECEANKDEQAAPKPMANIEPAAASESQDKESKHRPPTRRWAALGIGCLLLIAASVVLIQNSPDNHSQRSRSVVLPGDCAKTTAQLFDPGTKTRRLLASYELYMYVPYQRAPSTHHDWAHFLEYHNRSIKHEVIHNAEARLFALSYHNYTHRTMRQVIAKFALPPGASLLPGSVCLYRNNSYKQGARYTTSTLVESSGLEIGNYAPDASAYITFWASLPDVYHLSCGLSEVAFIGKAGTEGLTDDNWAGNASPVILNFERRC